MPPSRPLQQILNELRGALDSSADLDPDTRSALEGAAGEIRSALGEGGRAAEDLSESIRERLGDALARFEGSHPRLTEIVTRLVDQLSELGI